MVRFSDTGTSSGMICAAVAPSSRQHCCFHCCYGFFCFRRTISNDPDLLALHIIAPIPSRTMHNLALEVVQALDVRILWLIELSNSGDQKVTFDCVVWAELGVLATSDLDIHFPA